MRKISLGLGFAALVASQAFWLGSTAYAAESLAPTASNLQLAAAEVLDVSAIHREQRARGGEVELLWEDFSDAAFPPAGWSRLLLFGTASDQWARDTAQSSSAPASAKRNWGSGYQDDWLVTPVVELGPGTNTLYFIDAGQWMEDYTYGGVWLSNGSCDPADGDFVELAEIDDTPGSSSAIVWRSEPVAIDLSSYAEQDVCLAFVYQGDFGPTWWIDDVHVTNGDPLPPAQIGVDPAALAITVEYDEAESQNVSVMNLADAGSQDLEFTTTITRLVDGDAELTQSNSTSIVNSLGVCGSGDPQTSTADNSFWRVFDLADHGITSDFSVTSIETGIGFNTASNAQTLNVYTVDGDFELANLTLLGSAGYTVAPADQATVIEVNFDLPVTVPAGSIMAIEQHIPASGGTYRAHVAANELGQTGDTYWSSTDCGAAYFEPQSLVDALSAPADLSWVLAVHGHEDDGSIVPTVTVVPDIGAIAGDSFLDLTVTADATGVVPDSRALYEYVMTINSNDPVTPAVQIPVNVNVISGGGGGGDPEIDVDPASLSASVAEGDTGTDTLTIANTAAPGSDALVWNIESEPAMAGSGVPERLGTPAGISRSADQQAQLIANEAARGSIIADGGFEAGSPNPFWDEASSNYGTLLCTIADCGTGTGTGPRTGTWWAWFGGIASAEIGYARQDVTIPSTNSATLSFWTEQVVCSGSADDFLQVSLDGDVLWTTTAADPSCGSLGYREISLDISAYAGGTHTLEFYSELQGGDTSNFFVDDVAITTDAAPPAVCDAPSGLSWLSLSSANGSTDAGDSVQIDVTYDATGLAAGTYNGNLCVTSNDPANPLVVVPVQMEVTGGGGGANGIYYSSLLNHPVSATVSGSTINLVTETVDNSGPISGDWDLNIWASSSNLQFWTISSNSTSLVLSGGQAAALQPGDTVGPGSTFQAASGSLTPVPEWRAGTDAYVGIRFNCDGRLANPVPGTVCYGYIRLTTTGTTGFPATIVEYAYDGDGNAITIPTSGGGSVGNGDLLVTPGAVDIQVPVGTAASTVLDFANEGSAALDWNLLPEVVTVLAEDFEGAFPATGWTLEDNSTAACPWFQTDGSGMSGFVPGDGSLGAGIDADDCGSGQTYDSSLISPAIDLTAHGQATLTFDLSYRQLGTTPNLSVDVSSDGGATWTTVEAYTANVGYSGAPAAQEVDLSAFTGQTINLRWHWNSTWTWWAFIDNVEVVARDSATWPLTCWDPAVEWLTVAPTSGSIAVGGDQAVTLDVSDSLSPGIYNTELCIESDNGSALPMVIVPVQVTVTAPEITVDPMAINAAADVGDSVTETLTIGNVGNGDLVYTLDEAPAAASNPRAHFPARLNTVPAAFDHSAIAHADQVSAQDLAKLHEQALMGDGQVSRAQVFGRGGRGGAQVPAYSNTGWANTDYVTLDALAPGALTSILDPQVGTIYAATFVDNDLSRQFFIASAPQNAGDVPADSYGYIDTATGAATVLGTVSGAPAGATWTTAAYDHTTGTVYAVSNGASNILFTVDTVTGAATQVGPITGAQIMIAIAVSPDGLLYGLDIGTDELVAIDKTTGAMAPIGPVGPDANFAQDMDFDPSTGVLYWAGYFGGGSSIMYTIDTGTGAATAIGPIENGAELLSFSIAVAGGNCSDPADVPWLSLDSTGGTIPAGGADHAIGVTLDGSGLSDGVYEASICVRSNDPDRAVVEVPVEFVVGSPALGTDLALNLFSVPGTVHAGDNVSLIASVANFGPNPATDVTVALALPAEFSFLSGRVIEGSGDWSCSAAGADVTCELVSGALPVGEFAAVLRVDVDVDALAEDGPVTTVGVVSNAGGDPNPANDEATAVTTIIGAPGDSIFANGFECAPGYPDCGPGEGEPGIYDDRDDFLANVLGGHYEEGFDNVPLNLVEDPLLFSQDGFSYSVYSALTYDPNEGGGGLWNGPGFISLNSAGDQIVVTFTSGNVSAVGGNFWATDIDFNATGTSVVFQLSNGTSHTVDVTSASTFTGFVTESTITSITIDAPDVPANAWTTMDNLIVGTR